MRNKIKTALLFILAGMLFYIYRENYQIWLKNIIGIQRKLIPLISQNFKGGEKLWLGFAFLFFYGVFHSMGPGHGKIIISSTAVTNKVNLKKIIILAGIISYLQGFSALFVYKLFISMGTKLIPALSFNLEESSRKISALLLIAMGVYFFQKELKKRNSCLDKTDKRNSYFASFLIGIIPCSGILNILIFLNLLKIEEYSFLSVMSICSGMFFTLVLSGLSSNFIRNTVVKNRGQIKYVRYAGFLIMILYGFNFIF